MGKFITEVFIFVVILFLAACTSSVNNDSISMDSIKESRTPIQPLSSLTKTSSPSKTPPTRPSSTNTLAPTEPPTTTLLFTGIIVPARCVQAAVEKRGNADYFYENVRELLTEADITVGTLSASLSDSVRHEGCVNSWELVGGGINADAMQNAGFDLIAMATNHIKDCGWPDCGDLAFLDTLAHLERVDLPRVGAGYDLEDALKPVVIEVNGIRFGFVSLGEVFVKERIFAGPDSPGIALLDEENLREAIAAVKEVSDVVIVLPHSGPEDFIEPSSTQRKWARVAVDAGADLVVMNHAHVVQPYQEIDGVLVFYGLGNFVFDQVWDREHQQSVLLRVVFDGATLVSFEFIPTIVDQGGTVHLAEDDEAAEIINRIEAASEALK